MYKCDNISHFTVARRPNNEFIYYFSSAIRDRINGNRLCGYCIVNVRNYRSRGATARDIFRRGRCEYTTDVLYSEDRPAHLQRTSPLSIFSGNFSSLENTPLISSGKYYSPRNWCNQLRTRSERGREGLRSSYVPRPAR